MNVRAILVTAALTIAAAHLFGQTAQITGRVTDSTGAVVPGAEVTPRIVGTGVKDLATTNETGYCTVVSLPPGAYELTVQKTGFRPMVQSGVRLEVQQIARLDFVLEVGPVTERIEVAGEAPLVSSMEMPDDPLRR